MATIGSAKATLVNKIDTLTASATAKDTIYLAKALKENTTHHSFTFQGAWAATTAYALDDVVTTSGKTYICIVAHTSGASFAVGSNWSLMAEKGDAGTNGTNGTNGTDGTDLTSTLTTAGDVVYKGASALTRLAKGTASQVLTMNTGATAPEWADAATGGAMTKILTTVVNNGAGILVLDNIFTSTYKKYKVVFSNLVPNTNNVYLNIRLRNTSGSEVSASNYRYFNNGGEVYSGGGGVTNHYGWNSAAAQLGGGGGNPGQTDGYGGISGELTFYDPMSTTHRAHFSGYSVLTRSDNANLIASGFGATFGDTTNAYRGFQFEWSAGSHKSGHITVYGYED